MVIDSKKIREELHLSQQELANLTGIPKGRINAWEQRGTTPKVEDYKKLERFLLEYKSSHTYPATSLLPDQADMKELITVLKEQLRVKDEQIRFLQEQLRSCSEEKPLKKAN